MRLFCFKTHNPLLEKAEHQTFNRKFLCILRHRIRQRIIYFHNTLYRQIFGAPKRIERQALTPFRQFNPLELGYDMLTVA